MSGQSRDASGAQSIAPSTAEQTDGPILSGPAGQTAAISSATLTPPTTTADTGTFVGQKVKDLRGDLGRLQAGVTQRGQTLQQLRQNLQQTSGTYFSIVGGISTRLQVGTTPGNPQLIAQWNQAQVQLDRISEDVARLANLSNAVASDSSLAAFMLEATRAAYGLQGAVEEDHRQLSVLENDVNRTVVLIDRLLNDLTEDISRQSVAMSSERSNLTALSVAIKNGELFGGSLANRAFSSSAAPSFNLSPPSGSTGKTSDTTIGTGDRRPLVVIRFDRPNVSYEQALYTAVSKALERKPQAAFDVVAVAPNNGSQAQAAVNSTIAKRNAEGVLRSLASMGLPSDRIGLSATSSQNAQSNEVHLYVR